MSTIYYYPQFSELLSDGRLRVKTSGISPDGEHWDGIEEVGPEHPNYDQWLEIILNKEQHLEAMREEVKQTRIERRRDPKRHSKTSG